MDREEELAAFKRNIDLRSYAEGQGFIEDKRASSISSVGYKHPSTDQKILIGIDAKDDWVFYSVRPLGVQGTVIQLDQHLHGGTMGHVRKRLRPWLDGTASAPPPPPSRPKRLKHQPVDLEAVRTSYSHAQSVHALGGVHAYLNGPRGLQTALLAQDRFRGRVAIDGRGNALFPHYGQDRQLVGYEIKNDAFTGYSPGGQKGLWISAGQDQDHRLVVAETAIDALSYAQLFDDGRTRYASIAGQMNPYQPGLLHRAIRALPQGSELVLAVDHDDGGQMIAEYIEPIFESVQTTRPDISRRVHRPAAPGADWNDEIRTLQTPKTAPQPGPG